MSEKEKSSNRWWESYFIRYFVGCAFGALILLILLFHEGSGIKELLVNKFSMEYLSLVFLVKEEALTPFLLAVFVAGIAFCYISTAPILVLHALRMYISYNKKFLMDLTITTFIIAILSFLVIVSMICLTAVFYDSSIWFLVPYISLLVLVFSLCCIPWVKNHTSKLYCFSKSLAEYRAKDKKQIDEYVESYRHLREHGNAFFVIPLEIILGCALFKVSSISHAAIIIFVWVIPAVTVWFMATYLESKLGEVHRPDIYRPR